MAKVKQLPAGKSKAAKLKEAAKRKAATSKKKKATTKVADPSVATPTAPLSAQAPVSSPTGSLISPETWAQDQARLQSAAEDQDTADSLNEAEADADATYTSRTTEAAKAAALRKIELQKQKDQFDKEKSTDFKNLNTNMAYRGASRSSAADRSTKELGNQHTNIANSYKDAELSVDTEVSDINTKAFNEREATKSYVNKRRGTLAQRAAARGVYSEGAGSEDGGVNAPGIDGPATPAAKAAKAAKTYKGKYRGPDKYKGNMAKVAAAKRAAAAKRRVKGKK
jgi:hypothetical protein